jgi:hypothetical protein
VNSTCRLVAGAEHLLEVLEHAQIDATSPFDGTSRVTCVNT